MHSSLPWESSGVVQVKVRDEEQVDLVGLYHVDEGECVHPGEARVDAAVEQDALLLELEHVARPAHLLPGPQRADDHPVLLGPPRGGGGDRPAEDMHVRHGGDVHRGGPACFKQRRLGNVYLFSTFSVGRW